MTDWKEAGRKADAHRVRALYREAFVSEAKTVARKRVIEAMRSAGVTTVLDLWGGGQSAEQLVAAGFRVIAVENGTMVIEDQGRPVGRERKRRALEYAAIEGGYEARFGNVEDFAHEADGAYLDFCGPWSSGARKAVIACRHMKAAAVTLTPDHDMASGASNSREREFAYQLFLKMAWSDRPTWEAMMGRGGVRRLLDYRRGRGFSVFLYLLSHERIRLSVLKASDRERTRPDIHARHNAVKRAYYHRLSPEKKQAANTRQKARWKERYDTDPVFRAAQMLKVRHRGHLPGVVLKRDCSLCEVGQLGPASPA